ncbi:MAG: hypothetical protein KZQ70_15245 [gamma proteobacterium symbiont of Lucinoma myriamae]|nr:hypothetical protein [gamma proteobacterium symbiont of Lucinoma myriamae]
MKQKLEKPTMENLIAYTNEMVKNPEIDPQEAIKTQQLWLMGELEFEVKDINNVGILPCAKCLGACWLNPICYVWCITHCKE